MSICKYCGIEFKRKPHTKGIYCSRKCSGLDNRSSNNQFWKGGKILRKDGYIEVYTGRHKENKHPIYELEHRVVMENYLGRNLTNIELVHHRNGKKTDNRIENLELISLKKHSSLHHSKKDKSKWVKVECECCGKIFNKRTNQIKITNSNYCSHQCWCEKNKGEHTLICNQCKSKFTVRSKGIKRKFCSKNCYYKSKKTKR